MVNTEERRHRHGLALPRGLSLMSLMVLICAVAQTCVLATQAQAQCDCLNTFEFDPDLEIPCLPDTGSPGVDDFVLVGGDIAGNKAPITGVPQPDGLINELDLIRLISHPSISRSRGSQRLGSGADTSSSANAGFLRLGLIIWLLTGFAHQRNFAFAGPCDAAQTCAGIS